MKKKTLMRKQSGSAAGFTLIELMIVVAIIGILAAVAIPNFLRARDKARYTQCVEALSGVKVAQEMYISDIGEYADTLERLAMYMIPGCTQQNPPAGTAGCDIAARLGNNCNTITLTRTNNYDYQIDGAAQDRFNCLICVNPVGYFPDKYSDCATGMALTCP